MATQDDVKAHLDANPDATLSQIMEATGCSKPTAVEGRKAWRADNATDDGGGDEGKAEAEGDLAEEYPPTPPKEKVPKPSEDDVKQAQPKTYILRLR